MRCSRGSSTAPGKPSEYWTYMLSRQSVAGICGQAGMPAKRARIRSVSSRGSVCGKLPTTVGIARKSGRGKTASMSPAPRGGRKGAPEQFVGNRKEVF